PSRPLLAPPDDRADGADGDGADERQHAEEERRCDDGVGAAPERDQGAGEPELLDAEAARRDRDRADQPRERPRRQRLEEGDAGHPGRVHAGEHDAEQGELVRERRRGQERPVAGDDADRLGRIVASFSPHSLRGGRWSTARTRVAALPENAPMRRACPSLRNVTTAVAIRATSTATATRLIVRTAGPVSPVPRAAIANTGMTMFA